MYEEGRYPKMNIRSKNELAKRISSKRFSQERALGLINEVIINKDKYWHDNKRASNIDKEKYVRSAKGTPLGNLLRLIDKRVVAPHDYLLPGFIFGGVYKKSHVTAAIYLLGKLKLRTKLSLDVSRFFEQNKHDRLVYFFNTKCFCSKKVAYILADLCCVPEGKKGSSLKNKTLARGFATSTRLATWCNLDLFLRVDWLVKKELKDHDPRVAIFVDDIGITASRVSLKQIILLAEKIRLILEDPNSNQKLFLNSNKNNIQGPGQSPEQLGLMLGRNKLSIGKKTRQNIKRINNSLKSKTLNYKRKKELVTSKKSLNIYRRYIKDAQKNILV